MLPEGVAEAAKERQSRRQDRRPARSGKGEGLQEAILPYFEGLLTGKFREKEIQEMISHCQAG